MTTLHEAAQQMLEALAAMTANGRVPPTAKAFHSAKHAATVLRQALEAEQQDEPIRVATVTGVDEYGPMLNWHRPWVDMVGKHLYDGPQPARQHPRHQRSSR